MLYRKQLSNEKIVSDGSRISLSSVSSDVDQRQIDRQANAQNMRTIVG